MHVRRSYAALALALGVAATCGGISPTLGGTAVATASGVQRPFSDTSAWNVRIPARPAHDVKSRAIVARLARADGGYALLYEFGTPVYDGTAADPAVRVSCTMPWGTCDLEKRTVHIPAAARPNAGSDGAMVVVDRPSRTVCDFWQARRRTATVWTTSWGTCASLDGSGRGPSGGATGAGVNGLAGVVRTAEIRQGHIDHALSFGTDNACARALRYPATKTDGLSRRPDCIPEGGRIQLDPTIDVNAIRGITPGERVVAKALQTYGAYVRDNAAAPMAFAFEKPTGEPDPYPSAGFRWDYDAMPHIPWDRLRVLRSWNSR